MQPRRKGRIATKARNLAEHLQKCVLREILRFRGIIGHAQTDGVDSCLVGMKQCAKRIRIALLGALDEIRGKRFRTTRVAIHESFLSDVESKLWRTEWKCRTHT